MQKRWAAPETSIPKALAGDAAREAGYRFLKNEAVTFDKILAPHIAQTVERARKHGTVAVIHDTTEFEFSGESRREGLGRLRHKGQGFFAHTALAASADGQRRPLGVLGVETIFRLGPAKGKRTPAQIRKDPDKEALRWGRLAEKTEEKLKGQAVPVHVMDREGDSYDLFLFFIAHEMRFVVRAAHDRAVTGPGEDVRLRQALQPAPVILEREVQISYRNTKKATPQQRRIHPAREGRVAKLTFRAMAVELKRPKHASHKLPASVKVNVVHVWEVDCPAELHPVEWILLTSQSIETVDEIARVVDLYRTRWLIEEFFKAIKTGCAYERRQLETSHSLLNLLAITMPIAWRLLLLRSFSRVAPPDAAATEALPATQVAALIAMRKGALCDKPTVREAMLAIAAIGGHIKNNGDPGWQVLWRGYRDLLLFEEGWSAARNYARRCDQS